MSTRGYLHCYNPAYMHFYVILKPVYPAFGGTEVWQSMTPEFKWVWKGINPEWCSVEDKGKMKPQQKQVSQLTFGCGIFVIPAAIEKSLTTAVYAAVGGNWDWCSPLPFLTLKEFSQQEIPFTKPKVWSYIKRQEVLVWRRQSLLVYQL